MGMDCGYAVDGAHFLDVWEISICVCQTGNIKD